MRERGELERLEGADGITRYVRVETPAVADCDPGGAAPKPPGAPPADPPEGMEP